MTLELVSPLISIIALAVSLFTAWFTILRRGWLRSTHPSLVAFCYEIGPGESVPLAKIFLRTLLFSTGKRGHVVEGLSLRVQEGNRREEFSFWGHGDSPASLVRGSGLFIPETGFGTNHHFNPGRRDLLFRFSQGTYQLELLAKVVGRESPVLLWRGDVDMPAGPFSTDINRESRVYFNWSLENHRYVATIEKPPP